MSGVIRIANINNYTLEFINGELILTPKHTPTVENVVVNNVVNCVNRDNRHKSSVVGPFKISNQLAEFLGKSDGTFMTRVDVTRDVNAYIRTNCLQDKTNGRKINPDARLTRLLKIKPDEQLTYFNLQRYMSPHLQKHT
jgi:chromatin remodeling complex protein RSC6